MTDLHNNARIGQQNINSTVYNQYLGREVRRFFNLPPHYPDVFIGREDDLPKIKELLFSDDNILLLVNGEGGIGKTTVAARYFHAYWEDYQHLAWVFVEESIIKALLNLAIALEVKFPQQASLEEQLGLLLTTLAQLDRPCLLVLDNANQRAELESYYPALRRCPNMHLLLTSRIADLPTAHSYSVQPLDETEAQQLFQKHYSLLTAEETQLLPAIFEAVGYNTLVIELMAKNLTNFNNVLEKRYTLHNLLADLREKGILHLSHSRAVLTNYHAGLQMQYAKAEDIIAAMYDLNDLTPTEQQLLTCFALLPAESIPYATLKTLITDIPELDQMLLRLTRSGWLDMDATNKDFKVSPVVQEVTLQKVENATKATEPLIEQLLTLLKYEFGTGHLLNATYEEGRLYARYGANVIDVLEEPSYALSVLTERVARYYNTVGNIALALTYFEAMLRNDQQLLTQAPENPTYKNGLAISYQYLGRTQSALGNLEDALTFYQQFNQLAQELQHDFSDNVEFKNLLAISYQCLGNTKSALGNLEDALTFYQQYNQLEQELHYDFPDHVESKNLLAISYQYLGETQIALGNLEGALAFYQQFNQLVQELHHDFPDRVDFKKCLATSYQYLGNTQSTLGNLEDALAFYQKDAQLSEELHHDFSDNVAFKKCLATSYQHLGRTQIALGNLEDALAFYQQFNQLAQELHHDFPDHVDFKE
ncbi:MAG: NB-ARC domain-containing protein, partial [Bacteroidota bacterium]